MITKEQLSVSFVNEIIKHGDLTVAARSVIKIHKRIISEKVNMFSEGYKKMFLENTNEALNYNIADYPDEDFTIDKICNNLILSLLMDYVNKKPVKDPLIIELERITGFIEEFKGRDLDFIDIMIYLSPDFHKTFDKRITHIAFKNLPELWMTIIDEINNFVKALMNDESTPRKKAKSKQLSYHWQGEPDELTEKFQKMVNSKLIAADTAEADFKAIFQAKPLDEIKPVRWIHTDVLLAYFIVKITEQLSFSDIYTKWKIAEACFEPTRNLKQAYQNYLKNKNEKPKHHHLVDELF